MNPHLPFSGPVANRQIGGTHYGVFLYQWKYCIFR